jgi:hypothetical protein
VLRVVLRLDILSLKGERKGRKRVTVQMKSVTHKEQSVATGGQALAQARLGVGPDRPR